MPYYNCKKLSFQKIVILSSLDEEFKDVLKNQF